MLNTMEQCEWSSVSVLNTMEPPGVRTEGPQSGARIDISHGLGGSGARNRNNNHIIILIILILILIDISHGQGGGGARKHGGWKN